MTTTRTAAARLREWADFYNRFDNQDRRDLIAGADALDLVATQAAELARLRTALEEIRTCVTSGCPSCREAATEALLASEVR
jgi:hypothetical protein